MRTNVDKRRKGKILFFVRQYLSVFKDEKEKFRIISPYSILRKKM
jgi:hypothetical protein